MTDELVPDELLRAFMVAYVANDGSMRAALSAVAPSLIARGKVEGLREAIAELDADDTSYPPKLWGARKRVLARADALAAKGET